MKKAYIILAIFLFSMGVELMAQDDTPVQWLHGWHGKSKRWDLYMPIFDEERQMTSNAPQYDNTSDGIIVARQEVQPSLGNDSETIIMGHSMGGLVTRDFERAWGATRTRGIVTIGAPNRGLKVADNLLNGNAATMFTNAISELKAGPSAQFFPRISDLINPLPSVSWKINNYIRSKTIDNFTKKVLFVKVDLLLNWILVNKDEQSLKDFRLNGTYVNSLNAYVPRVPVVNIVTEENSRSALRLANAFIDPPEDSGLGEYNDSGVISTVNSVQSVYKGFKDTHSVAKWTNLLMYGYHNDLENKWKRGENYLKSTFEGDYNQLIGSTRSVPVTKYRQVYVCPSDCEDNIWIKDGRAAARVAYCEPSDPADCHYEYQAYTTYEITSQPNDGLVPIDQQMLPGRTLNHPNVYHAMGVNHMEVGNHPNIQLQYNRVFNRGDRLNIPRRE